MNIKEKSESGGSMEYRLGQNNLSVYKCKKQTHLCDLT
jgi:hypothetical protein